MLNDDNSRKIRHVGGKPQPQQGAAESASVANSSNAAAAKAKPLAPKRQSGLLSRSPKGQKRHRPRKNMTKAGKIVLFSLLALLVVGAGIGLKFYFDVTNPAALFQEDPQPTLAPAPTPEETLAPGASPTPSPTPNPQAQLLSAADLEFMKDRVNILVLGIDESTERANWGSFRTDTMILVTIDFATNDVHMISVPRDSYVKIANSDGKVITKNGLPQFAKINSAFPTGGGAQKNGYEYAMGTVSYLVGGIPIHYYLGFNMNVVKEVVNAMGGVDYNVDVEVNMNGRQLHPGMQHMDGQAVLDYARQRKGSSDIARVDRQQRIIMAIFQQLKSSGQIQNLPEIYTAVEQNIQTNLSFKQITSLALLALQMDQSQLYKHTVDGEFLNMYTMSYWGVNTSKLNKLIQEVFGISVSTDAEINVSNIKAQIEANRALIAAELEAAKNAIAQADAILAQYGAWLSEDTQAQLKNAKSQLEDAVDMEDKAQLDAYTPPLVQLCNEILAALENAGAMPGTEPVVPEPTPDTGEISEIPEIPEETPAG